MAYPGFQREGCLRSGPIQKVGGGGGASGPIYEKWGGGGGGRFRSDIRKVGGGGGGGGHSALGPILLGTQKISTCTTCRYFLVETTYVTQADNFTYIGCIA